MAKLKEAKFKEQLKARAFSHVYLIYGEENYMKEYYVGKLRQALVDPAFADFNLHVHEKSASMDDILMDAQMLPMMGEYSVVLVHDYPLDKSKDAMDKLKAFFKDVPESCVLIFWMDSIVFDEGKEAKWRSVVNAFAKAGDAVNFERKTEGELARILVAKAKRRGCILDTETARYLVSVSGAELQVLFNELDKICAYVHEGTVTRAHIDQLAVKSLQARVFDLSRFILRGEADGAYHILRALFAQREEPIGILSVIASCYIDMYRVKCAKASGVTETDVAEYYPYRGREWLLRNAARDGAKISITMLRQALDILSETDEKMKSTGIDRQLLLEETVAKLLVIRNQ